MQPTNALEACQRASQVQIALQMTTKFGMSPIVEGHPTQLKMPRLDAYDAATI